MTLALSVKHLAFSVNEKGVMAVKRITPFVVYNSYSISF
jgi:hypothetical protein